VKKLTPILAFFVQAGERGSGIVACSTAVRGPVRESWKGIHRSTHRHLTEEFVEHLANSSEPAETVRALWGAWRQRDKGATLALLADNIVFALFVPQEVLPFGGETVGKPSVSDRLQMILEQFDTLSYKGKVTRTLGDNVHGMVAYRFRHKVTGETIDGVMRHVIEVRDGLIVRINEHHDIALVRAFMRLVSHSAAEQIGR
jgi:ketosteroid isomerase-like protein